MSNKNSTETGNSGGVEKIKQASASSKDTNARRRTDISMAQNVLLIWLDHNNTDGEHSTDRRGTITQLRRLVDNINTFTDCDQCIDFLTDIAAVKIFMIISGKLIQHIIPLIHDVTQLDCIYILCENKAYNQQWSKEWSKIKGVFTKISEICQILDEAGQQCEHDDISINFMSKTNGSSNTKLDQLNCSFMYTQIMKEILLTIEFTQQHINEFTNFCREVFVDNNYKLNSVNEFERKYRNETPIWWYSCDSFLYPMLNRALRTMDVEIIIKMGFFIRDLHEHIERLYSEQFSGDQSSQILTVHRGQSLSKTDFDQMVKTKGGLMAFNNFLSTSKDRNMSMTFAYKAEFNPDLVDILFIIAIDPSESSTPFASINYVSCLEEDEVLFSMHTVFRIREIKQMGETNHLWQVDLTLTRDNDQELRELTESMREGTFPNSKGWERLGLLLLKMGHPEKAQQVYEVILEQTTDDNGIATIYGQLGSTKKSCGKYNEALTFYESSLEMYKKLLPPNHPDLAGCYNNIGLVYVEMGEYSKALSYYEKGLEINRKVLPPDYLSLAGSYNNIGEVYRHTGEYSTALSYYEKDLEISRKILPPNHPDLAISYSSIGTVHQEMGEYTKGLSSHGKAFDIRQKILPPNHPDLAASYSNIGIVHKEMGEYAKALLSHEKSFEIYQTVLTPNHPDLAASYNNIGSVYYKMVKYSKALSSFEKSLEIYQTVLPPNHPKLAASYNNIGIVHQEIGEYAKALSSHGKASGIRQKILPPNHPDLAASYSNIGNVYHKMVEYSKALTSFEKALEIYQTILPPNHPNLAVSYNNIGHMYVKMGEYSKAYSFFERAMDIEQRSLPPAHPKLQRYRTLLDLMK